ncbi:MAG TPA: galactitol-1-phosphate 5-dehydrogenase [Ktedonobacteraceae bacterium]|jgi:threonine dehydrogenase-like Zn-dependent dehydrogenase|nr:galactitol-1-phosphate 5-dehydrogenase [Ktedonobacteraceae bacterium]
MSETKQMEALVWLGPRAMEMLPTAVLEPRPGEVLIAVRAAGICGSELSGYLGQNSLRTPPLVMGHEAAGQIVQSTEGTFADGSPARVGARVTFNPLVTCGVCDRCRAGLTNLCRQRQLIGAHRPGAFAPFVTVPAAQCHPLPDDLSDTIASLTEPLACSLRAVKLTQVRPKQSLLILGAGPIGLFALIAARAEGIKRVYVSDLSEPRLAVARQWGASETINVHEHDVLKTIQELSPGGVDTVIDAVGANATRAQAVQAVVPGGNVVFIGLHDETSSLATNYLVRQEITIHGSFSYDHSDFKRAFDLLTQGLLRAGTDWLEERPLAAGPSSFAELVDGQAVATKIVLRID